MGVHRTLIAFVAAVAVAGTTLLLGCPPRLASPPAPVEEPPAGRLEGTIRVSGAWALYPMVITWGEEFRAIHPGVRMDISAGGAGKGAADALGGLVDIGMVSRAIHPDEESKGGWWVPVAKDAVFPVVNAENPVLDDLRATGVERETLVGIWITGSVTTWGEVAGTTARDAIHVYTRSDACGAAETWANFLGKAQEDLQGIGVYGDPGLAEAVRNDALGVGFNNLNYAYDLETGAPVSGLCILPVDVNGNGTLDGEEDFYSSQADVLNAIAEDRYPSPPARALNLLCKGKPTGVVAEFIRWVLTDGQELAPAAGYIPLTDEQVKDALQNLE